MTSLMLLARGSLTQIKLPTSHVIRTSTVKGGVKGLFLEPCTRTSMDRYLSCLTLSVTQQRRTSCPVPSSCIAQLIHVEQRRYAGHSHWQNTRHIKGANDAKKMKVADQFTKKIRLAIADGGSNDPKVNGTLARVIEQAKNSDIPKATIERALKKATEAETPIHVVEAKGPATSFMFIKVQTSTLNRTKQLLQKELKKFGGMIGESGTAAHAFNHEGLVRVELAPDSSVDEDKAMDIAIEVGAEDVSCRCEEGDNFLEFTCNPRDIHSVRRNLEKMEYNVTHADDRYVPSTTVELNAEGLQYVEKAYEKLTSNVEGVVEIYDNIVEESS